MNHELIRRLNGIIHQLVDTVNDPDPEKWSTAVSGMLHVLQYQDSTVEKIELKGTYNRYFKDEVSVNAYHHGNYSRDVVLDLSTIERTLGDSYHPHQNHFRVLLSHLDTIRNQHTNEHAKVLHQIKQLVEFFAELIESSENKVVTFLNRLLNHELRQLPNLQLQLEEMSIYLSEAQASLLGLYLNIEPESVESLYHEDSLHGFQSKLVFECSDTNLRNLFYMFLQILSVRYQPSPADYDFKDAIVRMLSIYMSKCHVSWLEISDYETLELKLDTFYTFLITIESPHQDLWKKLCGELFSSYSIFPELGLESIPDESQSAAGNGHTEEYNHLANTSVLPRSEQVDLLNNVHRILSQLGDFNFDFDTLFPKSLRFFIESLQHSEELATEADFSYLTDLINIINSIVDYENDDSANGGDVYRASLSFYELHKLLSTEFLESTQPSLLMRYCAYMVKSERDLVASILQGWNTRVLGLSQLEYNLEHLWKPQGARKSMKAAFDIWHESYSHYDRMKTAAGDYYDKSLEAKVFFSDWTLKSRKYKALNVKETNLLYAKSMKRWNQALLRKKELTRKANSYSYESTLKQYFGVWQSKSMKIRKLAIESTILRNEHEQRTNEMVIQHLFSRWYHLIALDQDISELTNKLKALTVTEKRFILAHYFDTLKRQHGFKAKEKRIIEVSNHTILRFFFQKWAHLYKLQFIVHDFQNERGIKFKSNALLHWKRKTDIFQQASNYNRARLVRRFFKNWQLKTVSSQFYASNLRDIHLKTNSPTGTSINSQLKVYFKIWVLARKSAVVLQINNAALVELLFSKWKSKSDACRTRENTAVLFREQSALRSHFYAWYNVHQFENELPAIADNFYLKNHWQILRSKHKHCLETLGDAVEQHKKRYPLREVMSLEDQIPLHAALRLWKWKKESKFEELAEWKIAMFEERVLHPRIKHRYLFEWVLEYNNSKSNKAHLNYICNRFLEKSRLKHFFLKKWINKTQRVTDLDASADMFRDRLLYKKHTVIWYDKYLNKGPYLDEISQDLLDHKELKLQRDVLSEWSMKYIKFITRHQQSCELFQKRWESARLKSIFDLWLFKLLSREQSFQESPTKKNVFLDASSESIVVNDSPLAFKNRPLSKSPPSRANETFTTAGESYLTSPIKAKGMPPKTPQISNTSPSRLQTSLRIKNERLQALKQHYSKARSQTSFRVSPVRTSKPQPVQTYSFLSEKLRLSPPKRPDFSSPDISDSRAVKQELPPSLNISAFDLEEIRKSGIVSPPFSSTPKKETPASSETRPRITRTLTEKDIEEAKRLRKITPIVIPTSTDEDPRISPIRMLKQRHSVTDSN